MIEDSPLYSVSELNRAAKQLLSSHFLTVRVEGEVSNFSMPSSGHWYFSLKDAQAQIRCAMFRGQQTGLSFKPNNGDRVIACAQVSLYEPRGDYQLIVEHLEAAGDGALRQAFERLKSQLFREGLFDEQRKRPIPVIPMQIGIITSATGAALFDILSVLKRRFPAIPVLIYPTAVQGESAKFEICTALELANQQKQVDLLILARGGGSLEDLWAFNEEIVARAIAASEIPVISGIGHEVDFTIADFVADLRAPTPSAAAEHAVPHQSQWLNSFRLIEQQLLERLQRTLSNQKQRLDWLHKSLQRQNPAEKLQRNAQRLDELEQRLHQAMNTQFRQHGHRLILLKQKLEQHNPSIDIFRHRQTLVYQQQRLERAIHFKLTTLRQGQTAMTQTLHAVSPLATLERGYAIVQRPQTQSVIKSIKELKPNTLIDIQLADGRIQSEIKALCFDDHLSQHND